MKFTHLDLFSGIGGFALAARWTGWETVGFSEIDPYASKILRKHWPGIPNFGDIRNVKNINAELLTGGFPCQPFSCAGQQRSTADDRYLWPEMFRVICDVQPTWALIENVPGIIKLALDTVLTDLENAGYACQPFNIPACALNAPHQRKRIWVVAHRSGNRIQKSTGQDGQPQCDGFTSGGLDAVRGGEGVSNANGEPVERVAITRDEYRQWQLEPDVGRVADGIPARMDRLKCLGNAIVPQIAAQFLGWIRKTYE